MTLSGPNLMCPNTSESTLTIFLHFTVQCHFKGKGCHDTEWVSLYLATDF